MSCCKWLSSRIWAFICCVIVLGILTSKASAVAVGRTFTRHCGSCGYVTKHEVLSVTKQPTCTEVAYGKVKCLQCGLVSGNLKILGTVLGHNWIEVSRTSATCTVPGIIYYGCSRCTEAKTEEIPSLGTEHIWEETARIEPTPETEGTITYTCSSCNKTKTETIPKLDPVNPEECTHDWQETGRTEPTIEEAGAVTYQCSICGKSRSEVLPKLEPEECIHDWKETDRTSPTETTPGQITYTCSKCGEVRTEAIPVRPQYNGTFMNWLGSVVGLFNMTLNSILGFAALRLHVGVLVFLAMFSLLAKLIQQGRKGRL